MFTTLPDDVWGAYGAVVFRHVALFRWASGTTDAQKDAIARRLGDLPDAIPTIRAYRFGPDARVNDGSFDFAVVADFDDAAAYVAYRDHPAHQAIIAECIAPIVAERAAVQYEADD